MELDKFLIGLLVFTAIIIGGVLIIGDINTNYDGIITEMNTSDFGTVYDNTDAIYNMSQDMKTGVLGGEVDEGDTSESMFQGGYKTLRFIQSSFGLVGDIINAIASKLGIPSFFITLALAALTISIIFGLIYLIFRVAKG